MGIHHQAFHQFYPDVAGSLVAESGNAMGQVEVVVDGLGHMHHMDPSGGHLFHLQGAVGGVVAPDGDQLIDIQPQQGGDGIFQMLVIFGGIVPGDADIGAAAEVDPADIIDRQPLGMIDIAAHDPFEAVFNAHHFHAFQDGPDGGGADNAVDARGRAAANQNGQFLWRFYHDMILLVKVGVCHRCATFPGYSPISGFMVSAWVVLRPLS